jgi:hypothetical protein
MIVNSRSSWHQLRNARARLAPHEQPPRLTEEALQYSALGKLSPCCGQPVDSCRLRAFRACVIRCRSAFPQASGRNRYRTSIVHFHPNRPACEKVRAVINSAPTMGVGELSKFSAVTFCAVSRGANQDDAFWFEHRHRSVDEGHSDQFSRYGGAALVASSARSCAVSDAGSNAIWRSFRLAEVWF